MQVKKNHPEKVCHLVYDQLHLGAAVFVYNEAIGQVVQLHEDSRFSLPYLFFLHLFVCPLRGQVASSMRIQFFF